MATTDRPADAIARVTLGDMDNKTTGGEAVKDLPPGTYRIDFRKVFIAKQRQLRSGDVILVVESQSKKR